MAETMDRTKYLGGSDIAGILGISPWRTPLDVYLDKVQPRKTDDTTQARRMAMNRGIRLEPYVIDMLHEEIGAELIERGRRYIDPEHNFIAAEIDAEFRLEGEEINGEIKTVSPFKAKEWGEEQTDEVPVHYVAQAMHGLMVRGRRLCIFGVLIGADDFRIYRVERDDELVATIREKEVEFWGRVQRLDPPESTTVSDVLRLFQKDSGRSIEASSAVVEAVNVLRQAKAQVKEAEAIATDAEERIKLFLQDNAVLTVGGAPVLTWKSQTSRRLDQSAFKAAHPALAEQFTKATEPRVFRLK